MIKVQVQKKDSIESIKISGHALYDDMGKDIVCAGVSAIVTTTINGILKVDDTLISYAVKNGNVEIKVVKENEISSILLENMIDLLKELQEKYNKNIKIEEVSL